VSQRHAKLEAGHKNPAVRLQITANGEQRWADDSPVEKPATFPVYSVTNTAESGNEHSTLMNACLSQYLSEHHHLITLPNEPGDNL
jgi:hypothetical protein